MTHAELIAEIDKFSHENKSPANRMVPTSFDPNDPTLRGFPISLDWKWTSCEQALRSQNSVGVMMRLPLFWQLEVPLYKACKSSGAFIFVSDRGNMTLAAEAIRIAHIDCVVTDIEDAVMFSNFLSKKSLMQPRSWIIVHPRTMPRTLPSHLSEAVGAQEVHLFPSVPILEQCEILRSLRQPLFHIHSDFQWDAELHAITSRAKIPVTLDRYPLPFTITEVGPCECGRAIVACSNLS